MSNLLKLANERLADFLEQCDVYPDFQYDSWSSCSTVDLLEIVADRVSRFFNISDATRYTLDISRFFERFCHKNRNFLRKILI